MGYDNVIKLKQPTQKTEITICFACANFVGDRKDYWARFCSAYPLTKSIDPVTGEEGYSTKNSVGNAIYGKQKYTLCRDINFGQCPKYIPT